MNIVFRDFARSRSGSSTKLWYLSNPLKIRWIGFDKGKHLSEHTEGIFSIILVGAKPSNNFARLGIDVTHHSDLRVPLKHIALVDACGRSGS